eukprot:jgi/Chlat1/78/Chrsp1S00209
MAAATAAAATGMAVSSPSSVVVVRGLAFRDIAAPLASAPRPSQLLLRSSRRQGGGIAAFSQHSASSRRRVEARRPLQLTCVLAPDAAATAQTEQKLEAGTFPAPGRNGEVGYTVVMKFGGSSVATAHRMKEVANLVMSFRDERPIIVLSAMGKTTNALIRAGEQAVEHGYDQDFLEESLTTVKQLHYTTADELGVSREVVKGLLEELTQLLTGVSLMRELTSRTLDYLVSFGERMSTRLFSAYLVTLGVMSKQHDAWDIGFITTDDFTNGDILPETYPAVAAALKPKADEPPHVPIVTGFLGRGKDTKAITTLGRGGSDLTATVLGAALGLREVWKDVDGVLSSDPNIVPTACTVPYLTFDEATELAYFGATVLHPQSMRPSMKCNVPVRVKNSYNPTHPGTLIACERDLSKTLLTSIVVKKNVTMLDIVSSRMLGQYGFLAKVFSIFEDLKISVDVVATSEVSVSLTLDPAKLWSRSLIQQELDNLLERFQNIAQVRLQQHKAIISLICNIQRSSEVLEKAFRAFRKAGVNVQMISQGASKVNIAILVDNSQAEACVQLLHDEFFAEQCQHYNDEIVSR